jgi:hypothetical protein
VKPTIRFRRMPTEADVADVLTILAALVAALPWMLR